MIFKHWIVQRRNWIPSILLLPILYLLGWLVVQPLNLLPLDLEASEVSLLGTVCTFIFFLLCLPTWVKERWKCYSPWNELGLIQLGRKSLMKNWINGYLWSVVLVCFLLVSLCLGSWCEWIGGFNLNNCLNAILLIFGVGFAEELVFRGWLWGEINFLFGPRWSLYIQAVIFSIAHIRFDLSFVEQGFLLFGLFLLGILLGLRRLIDRGSLIGCIALHGGLVGNWFLMQTDLIKISSNAPFWITGPGQPTPNPIGGILAIFVLLLIIWVHRNAFAIAALPSNGDRNASSKGATP